MAKETKSETVNNGCLSLLKNLDHDQLLEVLSKTPLCRNCEALLEDRVNSLHQTEKVCDGNNAKERDENSSWSLDSDWTHQKKSSSQDSMQSSEPNTQTKKDYQGSSSNKGCHSSQQLGFKELTDHELSEEQENVRASQMGHKDDFCMLERIDDRLKNVLKGLELYTRVFNAEEQKKIVDFVNNLQHKGQQGQLKGRTYSEPRKWMRGKGRVTIQFGCCYNYARDKYGNPPGIIRDAEVEPLPRLFKQMIKRIVRWRVLPETCVPDSCIVNIYEEGDCIPPHIDHHDFDRPYCTVSLLSDCSILFSSNIKIIDAGEFEGPIPIHLPIGSVLVSSGNGANIAKHCISAVSKKRISITFRKMNSRRLPYNFQQDPEMEGIKLLRGPPIKSRKHDFNKRFHAPTRKRESEFRYARRVRFRNN